MAYQKLNQVDTYDYERELVSAPAGVATRPSAFKRVLPLGYVALLVASFCLNGFLFFDRAALTANGQELSTLEQAPLPMPGRTALEDNSISPYAGVPRNVIKPLVEYTSYHNPENWTAAHEKWKNLDIDYAVVALSDDFARSKGLLTSMRFPWDQSKGVYVLHGMHNLHCLKILYLAVKEFQADEEQSIPWEHLSHCFDSIRQQLVCDADDTLRAGYAGQEGISGIGQSRVCRNWDVYEEWARNHTACYHRKNKPDFSVHPIEHYKYCPPDSGYVINETEHGT